MSEKKEAAAPAAAVSKQPVASAPAKPKAPATDVVEVKEDPKLCYKLKCRLRRGDVELPPGTLLDMDDADGELLSKRGDAELVRVKPVKKHAA